MESSVVKQAPYADSLLQARGRDAAGSFEELSRTFTDLLHKSAFRIEGGLNALTDRAGIGRLVERREFEPARESREPARTDDGRDRTDRNRPNDERRDDRVEARRNEHGDDRRERAPDVPRDRAETHRDDRSETSSASENSAVPAADGEHANDEAPSSRAAEGKTAAEGAHKGESSETKEHSGEKSRGAKTADGNPEAAAHQTAAKHAAELAIAGMLVNTSGETQSAGKTEAAATDPSTTSERAQRNEGLASALAALAKQSNQGAQVDGRSNGADHASAANAGDDGAEEAAAKFQFRDVLDRKSQQAATLAGKAGDDTRLQVNVSASDEARTLVSRPNATLAALAAADGGDGKSPIGQGPAQGTVGAQQAQNAAIQAQAAATAAAATNQAPGAAGGTTAGTFAQAITETKSVGQIQATAANGGATAQTGGGETGTQTGTGAGATTQNTQQSQTSQAHAAQAPRHAQFRQQVLEQVQVHVAKAAQSGSDKITIQLRPAELGRVEVRMEVGQDGRTTVHVTADRQDTLDLLQRDSRDLARSLQDAGLRADAGSLSFGLREQQAREQGKGRSPGNRPSGGIEQVGPETAEVSPDQGWSRRGRVDIRA